MSSVEVPYCPDEGDLIWIDFDPQVGREQAGRRPALVLSPLSYNQKVGLCVLCPITTRIKGFPFEVRIPDHAGVRGAVLADQVKSLSWEMRRASFVAQAPAALRSDVRAKLRALLRF